MATKVEKSSSEEEICWLNWNTTSYQWTVNPFTVCSKNTEEG